eukprot:2870807-Rhodomonas_salina.1
MLLCKVCLAATGKQLHSTDDSLISVYGLSQRAKDVKTVWGGGPVPMGEQIAAEDRLHEHDKFQRQIKRRQM